jgi:hypothetical protein
MEKARAESTGRKLSTHRRLPWIAPLSVLMWIALICGFSKFLERSPAPSALQPVRALLFEVPVGGLQDDNAHPSRALKRTTTMTGKGRSRNRYPASCVPRSKRARERAGRGGTTQSSLGPQSGAIWRYMHECAYTEP